ncbi:MAG: helix-turn-helix transcriptional regulator [Candidatus Glassbacteria bacterium]
MKQPSRPLLATLAENLRYYRHQKGLSQEKLAEICGYHRTYISDVERSKRNITLLGLETLAVALGVSASDLLTEREEKENHDSLYY